MHEGLYRGSEAVAKLAAARIVVCGVGAVGSNLADNLARQGCAGFRLIDFDRVDPHNAGTQRYGLDDAGALKVHALQQQLFDGCGIEVAVVSQRLEPGNARKHLSKADLVVDSFDNSASRQLVQDQSRALGVPCLHVGLYEDYAEAVWDEVYTVPKDATGDVCEYPLARNTVLLAVLIASEAVVDFLVEGKRRSFRATLRDFKVTES